MAFSYKTVHLSEDPCYTLDRSGLIENPYIPAIRTRFVQPGKIEIDANERAVIGKRNAAFSFAPSSILSLTICRTLFSLDFSQSYHTIIKKMCHNAEKTQFFYVPRQLSPPLSLTVLDPLLPLTSPSGSFPGRALPLCPLRGHPASPWRIPWARPPFPGVPWSCKPRPFP